MRTTDLICDGWEFSLTPIDTEYSPDLEMKPVDIPHDWLIYDTLDLYKTSTGWYRRTLNIPSDGMRTVLRFEGVYMDCRVYLNGILAGEWKYGYTTFDIDLTDLVREGENLLTVRVDHRSPNSRWYSGAGIYRKVWLERFEQEHIIPDGVYISADTDGSVLVTVEAARPESETASDLRVRASVCKKGSDTVLASAENDACAVDTSAVHPAVRRSRSKYSVNDLALSINDPELWDITSPQLYTCRTEFIKNGEVIDCKTVDFGFRSIRFTPDKGFFLNGRHVKLHGACEHHDLGALGAAVNRSAIRRKLLNLRAMGVNAIRTSHNPPAVELLELADEMGFLIVDECFDMWELQKTEYDYARFFPEWHERDVASWIRRDRNHPCIIGWSIGNEIYDTHASDRGQEVTSMLRAEVRKHDFRSNAYVTIGSNYMSSNNAQRCADILKVAGYNYAERLYDAHHAEHPDWMIYGSETSSVVSSRGIYHFPLERDILCEDDRQCSSLGNSAPAWASDRVEACIIPDRDREYCAGQFIWTGHDYIGEPTPYATKNSYFGQIDTAGFFKDSAYIYLSAWSDFRTDPFIHIFPYWDFTAGAVIDIRVASNAPRTALFFNGRLIKEQIFDRAHCQQLTMDTKLPFEKGELTSIAYDENGCEIARDSVRSFGDTASFRLTPDKTSIPAGGEEFIFVEISAVDKDGVFVANANDRVFVNVSGAGRLVGLDNGDSTDYEQYKGTSRRLFTGKLLAIIAPVKDSGEITLTVSSPALPDSVLKLEAYHAEPVKGISFLDRCTDRECDCPDVSKDIPIRRAELSGERTSFDPEHRELTFNVAVYPHNAAYTDEIEYRITTVDGIPSLSAEVTAHDEKSVTVKCSGDGEFYIRAIVKNGTGKCRSYSMLRLTAEGLGSAVIDPYKLVMGGLYAVSGGDVVIGIERGAAFGRNGGGWFGFENVDFGMSGSDEITIPLFANYNCPVPIEVWDGTPENGELIGDFMYTVPTKWMTYQPQTFKLTRKLRGVHTVSFRSGWRYDFQGFSFTRFPKETSEIFAADALSIYGDSFTQEQEAVTGIGNNVTLSFGDFDFTAAKPSKIVIKGRSKLPVNSIHLQCEGKETKRFLLEFEGCEDYTERSFPIDAIEDKCSISFCFLPGCDFDFLSFRFE